MGDMEMMEYEAEYTDTFGGEANYSWVRRYRFKAPVETSQREITRLAKKGLGITGTRGRTACIGEMLEFRPYRICAVMFVMPQY